MSQSTAHSTRASSSPTRAAGDGRSKGRDWERHRKTSLQGVSEDLRDFDNIRQGPAPTDSSVLVCLREQRSRTEAQVMH